MLNGQFALVITALPIPPEKLSKARCKGFSWLQLAHFRRRIFSTPYAASPQGK